MPIRVMIAAIVVCAALTGCTIPLESQTDDPPPPPEDLTTLDARLARCAALGTNAAIDAGCQSAWAQARRQILPPPPEQ
jgi:conjugative transfer region protein TrbK